MCQVKISLLVCVCVSLFKNMPKALIFSPKKLIKILLKKDFYIHHQTGSHINLRNYTKENLHVVIPYHNRDLALKTLKSILFQADLTEKDLIQK